MLSSFRDVELEILRGPTGRICLGASEKYNKFRLQKNLVFKKNIEFRIQFSLF